MIARLLRAELVYVLRRRRTVVALGVLAAVPVVLGVGVAASSGPGGPGVGTEAGMPRSGLMAASAENGLMLPVIALVVALALLLPLAVSIPAADALAGEAAHGSLRGLLLAPVSRPRLVAVKAAGVLAVAALAVLAVTVAGVLAGLGIVGGGGALLTLSGTTIEPGAALARVALAAGWTLLQVLAVGAVALAVSSVTDRAMVPVGTVVGGVVVSGLLAGVPSLDWLRPWLLTTRWPALVDVLRDPLPGDTLARGALLALGYLALGLVIAVAGTVRREA
ncbi:ABC transporter permease subunit [Pseudonocardia acaciae]|uniref:ABC transporter permease subunit n=1 Tax=Pseudonocardia acaciae TaxID=551276 RepID=UPI00055B2871|nr:ABC transporter permease subunit [Pseudonocardia acaciae]